MSRTSASMHAGRSAERCKPRQHGARAVGEVVQHRYGVAGPRQLDDDVRADVSGPAGHENGVRHRDSGYHSTR
jgi:hypothetical protein